MGKGLKSTLCRFPAGSAGKNLRANAGVTGSIPGSGRSPGGGNGNPLQCSGLENLMDRGACWATVHGVTESDMTEHALTAGPPAESEKRGPTFGSEVGSGAGM